jgi:TPR repeat protein
MRRLIAALTLCLVISGLAASPGAAASGADAEINPQRFGEKQEDDAYGAFQRGLYITALKLALERVKKGDGAAEMLAAEIYARGLGVPRDEKKAAELYKAAAERGIIAGKLQYALILLDGQFEKRDEDKAYELLKEAANAGNALAAFNFAQLALSRQPGPAGEKIATKYYLQAAGDGLADAQYAMARIYAAGEGGVPQDDVKARQYLVEAARQNYDAAQVDLGLWLLNGKGGTKDEKAGFRWIKAAAESGNVVAANRIAKLYREGIGTEGDPIEAAAWYITARRAGLNDPDMDVFLEGLTDDEQKAALERANKLH